MPPLEARVKAVLSGDTLVLSHPTNRHQERILSLAYVSAPRMRREGDEVRKSDLIILFEFKENPGCMIASGWTKLCAAAHLARWLVCCSRRSPGQPCLFWKLST